MSTSLSLLTRPTTIVNEIGLLNDIVLVVVLLTSPECRRIWPGWHLTVRVLPRGAGPSIR
jgi:hypothetical protein